MPFLLLAFWPSWLMDWDSGNNGNNLGRELPNHASTLNCTTSKQWKKTVRHDTGLAWRAHQPVWTFVTLTKENKKFNCKYKYAPFRHSEHQIFLEYWKIKIVCLIRIYVECLNPVVIRSFLKDSSKWCQKHGGMRDSSWSLSPWSYKKLNSYNSGKDSLCDTQTRLRDAHRKVWSWVNQGKQGKWKGRSTETGPWTQPGAHCRPGTE